MTLLASFAPYPAFPIIPEQLSLFMQSPPIVRHVAEREVTERSHSDAEHIIEVQTATVKIHLHHAISCWISASVNLRCKRAPSWATMRAAACEAKWPACFQLMPWVIPYSNPPAYMSPAPVVSIAFTSTTPCCCPDSPIATFTTWA